MKNHKFLDQNSFYMNPHTGSVASGKEWEDDFEQTDFSEENWKEWGGVDLIEVVKNENDNWIEVK